MLFFLSCHGEFRADRPSRPPPITCNGAMHPQFGQKKRGRNVGKVSVCPENSSLGPESPDPGRLRLEHRSKALPSQGLDSEEFLNIL